MATTSTYDASEIEIAASVYSDTFKEIHGIRPRWTCWEGATAAEIWAAVEALDAQAVEAAAELAEWIAEHEAMDALEAELAAERAVAEAEADEDALWAALEARACRQNVARACQRM